MYAIGREFRFSAAHYLTKVPADHKCARMHGHTYVVWVELGAAQLDERGFVVDYGEMTQMEQYIDACLDHRVLNEQLDFEPTAELLAQHFYEHCARWWPGKVRAVRVAESPHTWAEYR